LAIARVDQLTYNSLTWPEFPRLNIAVVWLIDNSVNAVRDALSLNGPPNVNPFT
jgi:hypothetical protein